MAINYNFGPDQEWFIGEDKELRFKIFGQDDITPVDPTGWTFDFLLKKSNRAVETLVHIPNSAIYIEGVFDANPSVNTQEVVVPVPSNATIGLAASVYRYSFARIDGGNRGILAFGDAALLGSAEHFT